MDRARAINLPPVIVWLSLVLIGVHVLRQFLSEASDEQLLYTFAFLPARYSTFGTLIPGGASARIWSPVSYAFLHADWVHLLVNIVWMASFGGPLARRFGAARFLLLSLVAAVAGAAFHYVVHPADQALVIGASGSISGVMAGTTRFAFSPNGPLAGGGAASFDAPAEPLGSAMRNRRAIAFVLVWFATNVIFGAFPGMIAGMSEPIAWEAHIGGFLAGLLVFPLLDPVRRVPPPGERLAS